MEEALVKAIGCRMFDAVVQSRGWLSVTVMGGAWQVGAIILSMMFQ